MHEPIAEQWVAGEREDDQGEQRESHFAEDETGDEAQDDESCGQKQDREEFMQVDQVIDLKDWADKAPYRDTVSLYPIHPRTSQIPSEIGFVL